MASAKRRAVVLRRRNESPSAHLVPLARSVPFGEGPEKRSSRPCTTASHYQSHCLIYPHLSLRFAFSLLAVFLPSRLPLIVFVFFCPRRCSVLAALCLFSPLCAFSSYHYLLVLFSPSPLTLSYSIISSTLVGGKSREPLSSPIFIIRLLHFIH